MVQRLRSKRDRRPQQTSAKIITTRREYIPPPPPPHQYPEVSCLTTSPMSSPVNLPTATTSSFRQFSMITSLSQRHVLQQRLQKHQLLSTFRVDCSGPQHAQLWRVTTFLDYIVIGESGWVSNQDTAQESAARQALDWLSANGYS